MRTTRVGHVGLTRDSKQYVALVRATWHVKRHTDTELGLAHDAAPRRLDPGARPRGGQSLQQALVLQQVVALALA